MAGDGKTNQDVPRSAGVDIKEAVVGKSANEIAKIFQLSQVFRKQKKCRKLNLDVGNDCGKLFTHGMSIYRLANKPMFLFGVRAKLRYVHIIQL